jgi:hypothetical protein
MHLQVVKSEQQVRQELVVLPEPLAALEPVILALV